MSGLKVSWRIGHLPGSCGGGGKVDGTEEMTRIEFTAALARLLSLMVAAGEFPALDYVKRSPEEQKLLFDRGLSKCDGVKILSRHQFGMAADIYFIRDNSLRDPLQGFEHWHKVWEDFGGKPMIGFDKGHFEF